MVSRGYGRIVNVSSVAGKEGNPNARALVWAGVALLVIATGVIGYGNMLAL